MPYKIVSEHEEGSTFRQIAEVYEVDFSRGAGFYELKKKEKVSANKQMVLFKNGKFLSDNSAEIRRLCGLAVCGDVIIEPRHVLVGHQLFVQSTSPNRKIPEESAVLFVVDDINEVDGGDSVKNENDDDEDEHDSKRQSTGPRMAVKFNELMTRFSAGDGDYDRFFNVKIGSLHIGCDERVPEKAQKDALYHLTQLFRVVWDETAFNFEIEDDGCYGVPAYYAKVTAKGECN